MVKNAEIRNTDRHQQQNFGPSQDCLMLLCCQGGFCTYKVAERIQQSTPLKACDLLMLNGTLRMVCLCEPRPCRALRPRRCNTGPGIYEESWRLAQFLAAVVSRLAARPAATWNFAGTADNGLQTMNTVVCNSPSSA